MTAMRGNSSEGETIKHLKEELEHFILLSKAQQEQLKRYEELQKKSHKLIEKLKTELDQEKRRKPYSFKK